MKSESADVIARFRDAQERLVERLKKDPTVLALLLLGSLSNDVVWRKSDIDLCIITNEARPQRESCTLVENDVIVHAFLLTRSQFKSLLQGALHSSFMHSLIMRGEVLFSRDETITEMLELRHELGTRDRAIQILSTAIGMLPSLDKAEKWLFAKSDTRYSFVWILRVVNDIARIETLFHGESAGREVIHQAMRFNPDLFQTIYTDLIDGPKDTVTLNHAIEVIHDYLKLHVEDIFGPILCYLDDAGGPRSATEIEHYFTGQMRLHGASSACEWLAAEGKIDQVSSPTRITDRSRIDMDEAAYYYDRRL